MLRSKRGFTVIELAIVIAISSILMGTLVSAFYYTSTVPSQLSNQINAENELRLALDQIQNDGVQAQSFTPGSDPYEYYGYFSSDPDPEGRGEGTIIYRYEDGQLVREQSIVDDLSIVRIIARHIVNVDDVAFDYDGDKVVTVNMTVTLNPNTQNEVSKKLSETDTRQIDMRATPWRRER
ncbi:MAG: type II secretion system protein [Dehalococcoidia bacterium]|nr:type II secretion system protein [Dehalococcoidia bacterium]